MAVRADERKAEIIDGLANKVATRVRDIAPDMGERFVRLFLRDVSPSDLVERDPGDLYGAALAVLRLAEVREPGEVNLRVYNPRLDQHGWQSTHTVVEIVNDDMPFLVDSVSMELQRHGLGIHLIVHPVLAIERDEGGRLTDVATPVDLPDVRRESLMHIEVDRISDTDLMAALETDLRRILHDVRAAVVDWQAMTGKVEVALADLAPARGQLPDEELDETAEFLRWLAGDAFTFLGYGAYHLEVDAEGAWLRRESGTALGILRGRADSGRSESFAALPPAIRAQAAMPRPIVTVTKGNARSTVHRPTYLDFVGVKRYAPNGTVLGEHRFLGLFTSFAYNLSPRAVPLLRRKIGAIIDRAGFSASGHAGKALIHVLETYPREELVQADEDHLLNTAIQIVQLQDRQRLRLFLRADPFGRLVSCVVYVPRDRYNTGTRERIQHLLEAAVGSKDCEFQTQLTESTLARLLFTIRTPHGIPHDLDIADLERKLVEASQGWMDRLRHALPEICGEEDGNRLFQQYGKALPASYQERVDPRLAVADIRAIDSLAKASTDTPILNLYRRIEDAADILRFKLIRRDRPVLLSDTLPILENMGLRVLNEDSSQLHAADGRDYAIHDFGLTPTVGGTVDIDRVRASFEAVFLDVLQDRAESDGFNRLVLAAGLTPFDITVLRACCKYLQQVGIPFSQAYIERTLAGNAKLSASLAALFRTRFDPDFEGDREAAVEGIEADIEEGLNAVQSLDEDRIIQRYRELIGAMLRTNGYQTGADGVRKPYLSFKLDPQKLADLPLPRPMFEIFVYAPFVEGVHLRGGKVARGGLRWSDRREDFRTEVLGLMKAQMVKNSVIVPVGAKGGFYVKRPPVGGDRQAVLAEAICCYQTFLRGLLDITDNQVGEQVKAPERVVRYDPDDPYLVVAADKGTATFSDIANGVSRDYGFWLDDAFASGGSAGYDHKKMGITAKGAWESVKRHFREVGLDPAKDEFTCIGIGDMSGDVFGNGMLLSDRIRLVAAFDHRHVFIDPSPDPAAAFAERQRLFGLPRSSWDDYARDLISHGGGIWPRTAKSIPLSPEARQVLGIDAEALAPTELISAILKAPVDLFWNGGIGTYVKAATESQAAAQDRVNDALRVDGETLRCKVVGEGGNLGITQKGRIAFALAGGRINTDFIDNSAGVDCSDHEVNIKILLRGVVESGDLTIKQRDALLAEMTDEVAALVLRDNLLQNLALSMGEARGQGGLDAQVRLLHKLERQGRLNRDLELLPSDAEIEIRRKAGRGLTRPESAVLLAYAKMTLYEDILATDLPDRTYLARDIKRYFPVPLRERFQAEIEKHPLRREIVSTWLANAMVNRGLETFASEVEDATGASLADITRAYVISRDSFALVPIWMAIEAVPPTVAAEAQIRLLLEVRDVLIRGARWFLSERSGPMKINEAVARFKPVVAAVLQTLPKLVTATHAAAIQTVAEGYRALDIGDELAATMSRLPFVMAACDIADVLEASGAEGTPDPARIEATARSYFSLDDALNLPWLRGCIERIPRTGRWSRLALTGLEDELGAALRRLTITALADDVPGDMETWLAQRAHGWTRYRSVMAELRAASGHDLSMLSVAIRSLGDLERSR
ncbi:MAG: NAD-glutamate dehydrogenase [Geminicoccaceae bacterium]